MLVAGGSTNVTTYYALRLTADGKAATGLTITGIDLQYVRSGVAPVAKVDATALAATDTAHTDNRAIEIDATDQPGLYRVDWPDAAFAAGVREVILSVKVATAFTEHLRCELDGEVNVVEWAGTDVVAGAIPAAAADAAGGLPISDAGGLDLDDLPTTSEFEARTLVAASYFDPAADAVATVTTLTNKTGFALSTAGILAIWHQAVSAIVNAGTIGKLLVDEITSVRMATLTDWINGGRLDLLLDAIPTTAMRGTDGANTTTPLSAAQVNAEMVDVLVTDTHAESSGVVAATASIRDAIMWLKALSRNKGTQTDSLKSLRNDGDSGNIATSTISKAAGTFTREKWS